MRFVKLHGLGNDYVFVDASRTREPAIGWARLARDISDRRRGVGSDGLILLCAPRRPDARCRMRIFNADGSEAQMCGNGVRCLMKFAREHAGLEVGQGPVPVEVGLQDPALVWVTPGLGPTGAMTHATVDMGRVIVGEHSAGFLAAEAKPAGPLLWSVGVAGQRVEFTPASVGNPHAVVLSSGTFDLEQLGPLLERHPAFPERVNVHVARADSREHVTMRTWERGSGLTHACGTGACAVVAVTHARGATGPAARVTLPGGDLQIQIDPRGHALMTGPAEEAFGGDWPDR